MQAVILCGGLGTRLKNKYKNIPKALVKLKKKPNLIKIIDDLFNQNFKEVILLTAYKNEQIHKSIKNHKNYKKIKILNDKKFTGTGGALVGANKFLKEKFLVILGDLYIDFNYKKFFTHSVNRKYNSNIVIHPNNHPFDSDTVSYYSNNKIKKFYLKNSSKIKPNNAIAGIFFIKKKIIKLKYNKKHVELVKDILVKNKLNFVYKTIEYIKDFGTEKRIFKIKKQILTNKHINFKIKKIAVFFDRDGVLNREVGVIKNLNKFQIIHSSIKAIKILNKLNIPCFLVSNQAALSKKIIKFKTFEKIHAKLENVLSKNKAYLDDYAYCPDFNGKKFTNKNFPYFSKYRKPNIGIINHLKNKYNLNLKKSFFIGDRDIDVLTGKKAGCKTFLVKSPKNKDYILDVKPDYFVKNAFYAVKKILLIK
tara:strand:+ start:231 stop:1493 length:1263 start_codon:yes stop_codon:yes gene_type:complete